MEVIDLVWIIVPIAVVFFILLIIILTIIPVGLWITARFSNVKVSIGNLNCNIKLH